MVGHVASIRTSLAQREVIDVGPVLLREIFGQGGPMPAALRASGGLPLGARVEIELVVSPRPWP